MKKIVNVTSPRGDFKLVGRCDDRSIIGTIIANGGQYEDNVMRCIEEHCSVESVIFDIGANIGVLSVFFSKIASQGEIISIEPGKENFFFLQENIALNNISNITALNIGVSDYNGKATFNYVPSVAGCSFISTSGVEEGIQEIVEIRTLDQIVNELNISKLDLIKLDVEGGELKLLEGAVQTIRRLKPNILIEWNPATMERFYNHNGGDLYQFLCKKWKNIFIIEQNGSLTQIESLETLEYRTMNGKGWEDLFCIN